MQHLVGSYLGYFFRRLYIYIYIYVWKLNQTVLELDLCAVLFLLAQQHQKRCSNITKISISLQKDYNYNQIDGYFAWTTSFISVCNLIWKMIWGSDCHVTISFRDVNIIILNFIKSKSWTLYLPYEKDALARESTLCIAGALIGGIW
jgi:hypothetical protein